MEGYAAESIQGSFSMPNAPLNDSGVQVRLDRLLVRIDHNLSNGATHHWPTQTSSPTRTFFLGLTLQGFMQAECRGSCDPRNVEGKTCHAMRVIVQTLRRAQGRMPLLLQVPRLVKPRRPILTRDWGVER